MRIKAINAASGPQPAGGYSQAVDVVGATRLVFVSGQIPETATGETPEGFEAQARLAWANVVAQLDAAGMTLDNLVRHTTYLSDRKYREANGRIRREVLGDRAPALTVIIADIFDEAWLLEIEAVAAA